MKNRLKELFARKDKNVLNVYFTAGYPELNDTAQIINQLDVAQVDLVEVGIPYSDPLADGETIQNSGSQALANGMTLQILFDQVKEARRTSDIPIVLMGYYNQMLQFGPDKFLQHCVDAGVDGLIIPDLPMSIYERDYQQLFSERGIMMTFLITPETSDERILQADRLSGGFIYVVSKSSITGSASDISDAQTAYFNRIDALGLKAPKLIGFGIHDKATYNTACTYSNGAIIGSAFIRALKKPGTIDEKVSQFINRIR